MSGIVSSLSNAIESATYNPEYAKKKEEEQKKIKVAVDAYKKDLEGYTKELDAPIKLPNSGPGEVPRTEYYVKKLTELLASEKKYVDGNPSSPEEVEKRRENTRNTMEDIRKANVSISLLTIYDKWIDGILKEVKAKRIKISKEEENLFVEIKSKIASFLKNAPNQNPRQVVETFKEIEYSINNRTNVQPAKSEEEIKKLEKDGEEAEKAEASVFSLRRMIWTIVGSAINTITILFLVMIFLVGGMLASNAAIGRPIPYRILYFVYGGLGSPFVILYYLYQWIFGTAPKLYTLLPIFTTVSDTSLSRFFFFPFTYTADQNQETLRMEYLKEAAAIVKKSVDAIQASAPPPDAPTIYDKIRNAATEKVVAENIKLPSSEKLQDLINQMEKMQLPGFGNPATNILQKLEGLRINSPRPSAPPPNVE